MKELIIELLPAWLVGDRRDQLLYVLALGLLGLGTLLCLAALRVRALDVLAVAVACAGAVAWLLSNTPGEGGTVVVVRPGNGLTTADLAALPAGVLVGYLSVRRLRSPWQGRRTAGTTGPRPTTSADRLESVTRPDPTAAARPERRRPSEGTS